MKVAIIVPVYNAEKYIKQCFYSISAQTHDDVEAIFVDDCSTDNSREILRKLAKKYDSDGRIKYTVIEHETNKNVSAARNSGIKYAMQVKADWLAFIDSDDMLTPNFTQILLEYAKKYPDAQIIQGGHVTVKDYDFNRLLFDDMTSEQWEIVYKLVVNAKEFKKEEDIIGSDKYGVVKFWLKHIRLYEKIALLGVWAALYKRDFIEKENIFFSDELSNTQDVYFRYLCFKNCQKVVIEHTPVYFYRSVEGSLSRKTDQYNRIKCWAICIEKMLPDACLYKEYSNFLLYWCFEWARYWVKEIKTEKESTLALRYLDILKKIKEKIEENEKI